MRIGGHTTSARRLRAMVLAVALALPIGGGVIAAAPAEAACTGTSIKWMGITIPLDRICTMADDCLKGRTCPKPGDLVDNGQVGS